MKVIVVGATGTIGKAVAAALEARHEVVRVGNTHGDVKVDIASADSIRAMYEQVGDFDALVSAAGRAAFKPLDQLTDADFDLSLSNKLMGQINLVRLGMQRVRTGGSFTLTSGVLAREPMPGSGAVSLVNAGLEGFVLAAALQMPRGARINIVSPPWVAETLQAMGRDPHGGLPAERVAAAYVASVEGEENGAILDARSFAM
ncbi:MAG TPA: short chain dehydrogenase [Longimicrobiaceae bacterium]|nr:short chain dehydrogenase [Longimicrobiaceae bacterium]